MYRYIKCSLTDDFDSFYDEIKEINQEFTSKNTSVNSGDVPAVFKMVNFEPGTVNLDYGGGRFDNVAEYLVDYDVINLVYDPFNREDAHNREVIKLLWECDGADSATCANVLNVIKEYDARHQVLVKMKKLMKPGAPAYFIFYEGSKDDRELGSRETSRGYQLFWKTQDYLEEIQEVFPDAIRKGKLIFGHA